MKKNQVKTTVTVYPACNLNVKRAYGLYRSNEKLAFGLLVINMTTGERQALTDLLTNAGYDGIGIVSEYFAPAYV